MEFTFAVLSYNQESIVLETLESIKYQIQIYGQEMSFNFILTDDGSKDNTVTIVNKWIDKNKKLFKNINIIANKKNVGTVKNYNVIMDIIGNEKFKVIAGDDVIGPESIFEDLSNDQKVIDTYPFCCLQDGKIFYKKEYLYDYFYRLHFYKQSKNLKWMKLGDFMHTPSTFYSKELYILSKSYDYNKKYYLFEDDPTFYSFFKNNNDITVRFHAKPLILYRFTSNSTSTIPNDYFLKDWRKLQYDYASDSKWIESKFYKLRAKSDFSKQLNFSRAFTKIKKIYRKVIIIVFFGKDFNIFLNSYIEKINIIKSYYNMIKEKSDCFIKEIKDDASY